MDNLGSHKSKAVRKLIHNAEARLWFLPKYSPDLNPIEQAFSKIKHWMRMAQKRSLEDIWHKLADLVDTFESQECANYFRNPGYASVKTRNALEISGLSGPKSRGRSYALLYNGEFCYRLEP